MTWLVDPYVASAGALDEVSSHPGYADVLRALETLGAEELLVRAARRDVLQREHGMTFSLEGAGERLLPLDLVPRLLALAEWQVLAAGLEQRARALNLLLLDLAGPREAVRAGVLPTSLVGPGPVVGPVGVAPATVAGMDLLRGTDGWCVLEDNLRVPSGLGYAMLVRQVVSSVLPEVFGGGLVDPSDSIPAVREALLAASPGGDALAVLSAGPADSAFAEHALLARELGVVVVTPEELTAGERLVGPQGPIDVLYRRLDDVELEGTELGEALPRLVRSGRLGLANALGCGVVDDKAVYAYVPAAIEFFLGEPALLPGVRTWALAEEHARAEALPRLRELVVKPVDGYGGRGVTFCAALSAADFGELRARIEGEPDRWVAQEVVEASTHPTLSATGDVAPCSVDLRAFVVSSGGADAGVRSTALPAALTRVAPMGSKVVNSSQGGGTKDTWIS